MKPRSVRLNFTENAEKALSLNEAGACLALPYPSADLGDRSGMTGVWVELKNESDEILYRLDLPCFIESFADDSESGAQSGYDALVPYLPEAAWVEVYVPEDWKTGAARTADKASILAGRFPLPGALKCGTKQEWELPADICGKGRGTVLRCHEVSKHGSTDNLYNFIVLGDRFDESEQSNFMEKAKNCINFLLSFSPFDSVYGLAAMNIFFVEVASVNKEAPYFDTSFASGQATRVYWSKEDVKTVCDALFSEEGMPFWNWAGVLINYTEKAVGTASGPQFADGIFEYGGVKYYEPGFQHEFGHTAFGLGDEYGYEGKTYHGDEPQNPNITKDHTLEKLKWKGFVTEDVPIPTTTKNESDVGCYEGGGACAHGLYHPQLKCVMNNHVEAGGYFCKVCRHVALKTMAHRFGLLVPAPNSLLYSNMSREWTNQIISSRAADKQKDFSNLPEYDAALQELRDKKIGPAVTGIFQKAGITLAADTKIIRAYDEGDEKSLWYLDLPIEHIVYYFYGFKIAMENGITIGKLLFPIFPTLYDGVVIGSQMHIFCGDTGSLTYGIQDLGGEIAKNLEPQTVPGLGAKPGITMVSTDYVSARIWIAVVDGFQVKIAAYQVMTQSWNKKGFLTMPSATGEEYLSVRITQSGNCVYAAAKTITGITFKAFDTASISWISTHDTIISEPVLYYDVCAGGNYIYLFTYDGAKASLHCYNRVEKKWKEPVDMTGMGLTPKKIITSLSTAVLTNYLHIVVMANGKPEHAIYNVLYEKWESALAKIQPPMSLSDTLGSMMLHADGNRLHLLLNDALPLLN